MAAEMTDGLMSKHTFPTTLRQAEEIIQEQTRKHITRYRCGDATSIQERVRELDSEWNIERALQFNAAIFTVLGVVFSAFRRRRGWMLLPAAVGLFLFQHATQGWCPPVSLLRRLGFRTQKEIDEEHYGLKVLRGDFQNIPLEERDRLNMDLLFAALKR